MQLSVHCHRQNAWQPPDAKGWNTYGGVVAKSGASPIAPKANKVLMVPQSGQSNPEDST